MKLTREQAEKAETAFDELRNYAKDKLPRRIYNRWSDRIDLIHAFLAEAAVSLPPEHPITAVKKEKKSEGKKKAD